MSFKKKINAFRRKTTRAITGGIGKSKAGAAIKKIQPAAVKTILINRPNHRLGNLLLITPLVQELIEQFPNCRIDLFVKGGLSPIIFENYPQIDRIIRLPKKPFKEPGKYLKVWATIRNRKYDLVVNVDKGSSSGRISTKVARSTYKIFGDEHESILTDFPDGIHIAKRPVYLLRANIEGYNHNAQTQPMPVLNIKLTEQELAKGKEILDGLVSAERKTISIFTYATGNKCYTPEWWEQFYEALKNRFSEYNILEVLPAENVSQLGFKIPHFYSMDVREIASLIANTHFFVGADSGMMHLASASLAATVGLFSVTNMAVYEPYGHKSFGINTAETTVEEMINRISQMAQQID